jgi:hypothetical protein
MQCQEINAKLIQHNAWILHSPWTDSQAAVDKRNKLYNRHRYSSVSQIQPYQKKMQYNTS